MPSSVSFYTCLIAFLASSLLGTAYAGLVDASPVSEEYVLRTWEIDDGLADNRVNGITQTPDGYLWLATPEGLARFDGARFTTFSPKNMPGLESAGLEAAFVSHDGTLWAGLDHGGVARWSGDLMETILPQDPKDRWITSFAEDAEGAVWFGEEAPTKIGRWKDGKVSIFPVEKLEGSGGSHAAMVVADKDGRIWYAHSDGCGFFEGDRVHPIDPKGERYIRLTAARGGGVWAVRGETLVRYRSDASRQVVLNIAGLLMPILLEDSWGNLWIGTNNAGLFRFRDGAIVRVPVSDTSITALFEDRDGNIWVGTKGGGINRLHATRFFLRQTRHGLLNNEIYSLTCDNEGRLWLAGQNHSVVRGLDSTNHAFAIPEGWPSWGTMALCHDSTGTVWFGTFGLGCWKDGLFSMDSLRQSVTALLSDRQENLWAATIDGPLIRHRNGQDEPVPAGHDLVAVRALAEDSAGRLWAGTEAGLVFQKQQEQFLPVPLPGGSHGQIRFIVPDENDTVWIGMLGGGLYRWRAGEMKQLPPDTGLPVEDLRSMAIGENGEIWITLKRRLFRVMRSELEAGMEGHKMHFDLYGKNDGVPNVEFAFGFRNAALRTPDGHIWFATYRGALEIGPETPQKSAAALPVLIEDVEVGGKSMPSAKNKRVTLPPHPGLLQTRYTVPQLSVPEQIRFRYRLIGGGDAEWIEAGYQRLASFTRLPPGDYRFEVAAAEPGGPWFPKPASLAFTVRAAWWETDWFRVCVIFCGAIVLAFAVRFVVKRRMRARMRRLEQEHALERERARIARDMHDDVGASLTQIAIATELARLDSPNIALEYLDEIATIAKHSVSALDEIVWAVNPRNDALPATLEYLGQYAAEFLSASGIQCEIDIPDEMRPVPLAAHVRHHLFLAVKESLANIAKHSGATEAQLKVEMSDDNLRIVISDNGRGFVYDSGRAGSDGLKNIRDRMTEVGGECRIESIPNEGTRIIFEIQLTAGLN